MSGRLGPAARTTALHAMGAAPLDVLVIGGGVVGAGVALDAVSRGLSVGLVEMRDWASGTSSRSSKLIHGGLRYLEMFDFRLVREALQERGLLLDRLAPHLVHRVPFLYPLRGHLPERVYVGAGLLLYDTFAHVPGQRRLVPGHRHLTRRAVRRVVPSLRLDGVTGAVQYYDAQVDDARFVVTLVRTAAAYGALVANRAVATSLRTKGGRVVGAVVRDHETGVDRVINARVVISATGVWSERTLGLADAGVVDRHLDVRASKGVHIVVPRDRIRSSTGLITRTRNSVLFVIPWGRHWIIGTTDTPWALDLERPAASARDIDYLLAEVNQHLVRPLTTDDVEGCYAGLRPLVADRDADTGPDTAALSREHVVLDVAPGLVVVAGGKYTTYRVMARDAVDAAARGLEGRIAASVTDRLPLLGADGYWARWNQRHLLARRARIHVASVEHLLNRYGSMTDELLDLIIEDPELGRPLSGAEDYLGAEIRYAVTHEGARYLTDILSRRTRISVETWDRGVSAASHAARLVADDLGWDDAAVARQISVYLRRIDAERVSQTMIDDWSAVSVLERSP